MRLQRLALIAAGPLAAAAFFTALSPDAATGGLHSLRAGAYVTAAMALSFGLALLASRRHRAWLTVTAGLVPAAIALGVVTIPTLHQRELHEDLPMALAADVTPMPTQVVSNAQSTAPSAVASSSPTSTPSLAARPTSLATPSRAAAPTTPTASTTGAPPSPAPVATRLVSGPLHGINHGASGRITIYRTGSTLLLRFEDVDIERVPDARIYLEPTNDAQSPSDNGLSLGPSKAEKGTFSYELPAGYALPSDVTLLVWCRAFATPVANATLA